MRRILIACILFAPLACGSTDDNPLLTEVAVQYGTSYCKKLEECVGKTAFQQSYPEGQEDCTQRTFRIHGTDERSICSQEQWDRCTEDLENSSCRMTDGVARPEIPESCQDC